MQISLYKQKLKRRWQKVLETKKLWQYAPTDIILGFVKTEKSDGQVNIKTNVKTPVLDKNWNKVKENYLVTFKSWRNLEKERVKTEEKVIEKSKLTLKVMKWANKNDIKESVQNLYWVKVDKVNIIKTPYKNRQRRWLVRRAYVKAIVTLKEWQKMPSLDKVA